MSELLNPRKRGRREKENSIIDSRHLTKGKTEGEQKKLSEGDDPWPRYARDAQDYRHFAVQFPDFKRLKEKFKGFHERGEKVLVLDVFGIADAKSLGADHTIGFTLNRPHDAPDSPSLTIVEGNALSTKDVDNLMRTIDATEEPLRCVFFSPHGGAGGYGSNLNANVKMYNLLKKVYERLSLDGEIYAEVSYFGYTAASLVRALNKLSSEPFCTSEEHEIEKPPRITHLHIIKSSSAPTALPAIEELSLDDRDQRNINEIFRNA